jgi:CRISPR/Cas system CSM-associated protein Csm3 (group 7 of RAMP superfamily)
VNPYRTLVFAEIVQESPLVVGGNLPHTLVDMPLARDGRGRPVLRGSTLAGCFIATARRMGGSLPRAITCDDTEALIPSAWRFAHAHPLTGNPVTVFFQHVSIDPRTQAAKDDHLFSVEALPAGTRWNFALEIVPSRETSLADLEAWAAAVLAEWSRPGGARLGRGSRHGYGWCHLESIRIVQLDTRQSAHWPDAAGPERSAQEWIDHLQAQGARVLDLEAFLPRSPLPSASRCGWVAEFSGSLHVGERQDPFGRGYGLDTLSVGGHARMQLQARDFFERVIPPPPDIPFAQENFDPDFTITAMPGPNGRLIPYVPGASIRGVWRAALNRHLTACGGDRAQIETLFGNTERAGRLSLADAYPRDDDWKLLWQQHVAIDEFSGGAYGAAKFDRLSLAQAHLGWRARIDADDEAQAKSLAESITALLDALGDGQLPLGGGIRRGHGHVRWQLEHLTVRPLGTAGERKAT